jgi:hypothetical protein
MTVVDLVVRAVEEVEHIEPSANAALEAVPDVRVHDPQ